jgi:hypothetical protein
MPTKTVAPEDTAAQATLPPAPARRNDDDETIAVSRQGLSPRTPVVISATTIMAGVPAEYAWLKQRFGVMEQDWSVDLRSLGRNEQGRTIETFRLQLKGGAKIDIHFDISSFHQL